MHRPLSRALQHFARPPRGRRRRHAAYTAPPIPNSPAATIPDPLIYVFGPEDDSIDVQALLTTDAVTNSGIGTYTITTSADSATSAGDVTYRLVTIDGALEITEASLTIIADDQTQDLRPGSSPSTATEFTIDPTTPLFTDDTWPRSRSTARARRKAAPPAPTHPIIITDAFGVGLVNYTSTSWTASSPSASPRSSSSPTTKPRPTARSSPSTAPSSPSTPTPRSSTTTR